MEEQNITQIAIEKLDKELSAFKGGNKETAVKTYVANTIRQFCTEDERFAYAFAHTARSLSDCCREVMQSAGSAISDIEVYRRAARFYFPNSEVQFKMLIEITGEAPTEEELSKEAEKETPAKQKSVKKAAVSAKPAGPKKSEAAPAPSRKELIPNAAPEKEFMQLSLFG